MGICVRGKSRREGVYFCSTLFGGEKEMLDFYWFLLESWFELSVGFWSDPKPTGLKCNKQ